MKGIINIKGIIGRREDYDEPMDNAQFVELVDVIAQVKKQPQATSFDVYINSEGGNVFVGFDIYEYLTSLDVPIHTIGEGVVASIATVPFMAGNTRQVKDGTRFIIHLPWGTWSGTSEEMSLFASEIKKQEDRLIEFYSEQLAISKEAVRPLLKNETWLTEQQLSELGFVNSEILRISARVSLNKKNKKMKKSKSESMLQKILDAIKGTEKINAKIIYDASEEQKEIVFPDVADEDDVVVGDTATIDGQPAQGSIVTADGRTFVFEDGTLREIIAAEETELDDVMSDEEFETLIADLRASLQAKEKSEEALRAENKAIKAKYEAEKSENKENKAILARIKAIKSEFEADTSKDKRSGFDGKEKVSRFQKAMMNQKK